MLVEGDREIVTAAAGMPSVFPRGNGLSLTLLGESRERAGVAVQRRLTAEVRVQDAGTGRDAAVLHEVDERRHRLPFVDRVGEHPLEPRAEADRLDRLLVRDAARAGMPLVEQDELLVAQLAAEADRRRGAARDPRDLLPRLQHGRAAVDPEDAPLPVLAGEAGDHPRLRRARDGADDDRVEEDAELALLGLDLVCPPCEAVAAEWVSGRAGRDRVRLPSARLDVGERLLP